MEVRCEYTTSAPAQVVHSKSLGYWTPLRVCEFEPRHLHQKNFKKCLDKSKGLWYNKDTERGKATRKKGKPTRASKTFPTKTLTRKVCRFASNKCEPEPRGWSNVGLCRLQSRSFRNIVENRAEKSALFFRVQHFESVGANTLRYGRNLKCWELKVLGEFVKN